MTRTAQKTPKALGELTDESAPGRGYFIEDKNILIAQQKGCMHQKPSQNTCHLPKTSLHLSTRVQRATVSSCSAHYLAFSTCFSSPRAEPSGVGERDRETSTTISVACVRACVRTRTRASLCVLCERACGQALLPHLQSPHKVWRGWNKVTTAQRND